MQGIFLIKLKDGLEILHILGLRRCEGKSNFCRKNSIPVALLRILKWTKIMIPVICSKSMSYNSIKYIGRTENLFFNMFELTDYC